MPDLRKTKIVATIGPACWEEGTLRRMMEAGLNVARLNFSHGSHEQHARIAERLRRVSTDLGLPLAILQDLQGPKIRVGRLEGGGPVHLEVGAEVVVTTEEIVGTAARVSTTYQSFPEDVEPGATVLLDDGMLQLKALEARGREVRCEVIVGGPLFENKGINLPGVRISAPALTGKDREDLLFGLGLGVDLVALSFVRQAGDVEQAREIIESQGASVPVIAKIERIEGVENLDSILATADGVMVARGDLGVETSSADVPLLQKDIIRASNRRGRLDITATQMLESMIENPRPTRAEACDVANAIFDGTDAIMLSGETATGKYPVEAVKAFHDIAVKAESRLGSFSRLTGDFAAGEQSVAAATARAAALAARAVGAKLIACMTRTGHAAVLLSQTRPCCTIVGLTPEPSTFRRLALAWGVVPAMIGEAESPEDMARKATDALRRTGLASPGDTVVVVTGRTVTAGATNTLRILKIEGP